MNIEVPKRAFDARVMYHCVRLISALARVSPKNHALLLAEVELTRLLGLFDRSHYLSQVDVNELGGMAPLNHYVLHGDAAGLSPSPLFDVGHYDAHCSPGKGVNRLLHYGLIARFKGISPSPWFDPEYYLRSNPDVAQAGLDPLMHFQRWGWRDGRSPLPGLDIRRVINARPEFRVVNGNGLAMFSPGQAFPFPWGTSGPGQSELALAASTALETPPDKGTEGWRDIDVLDPAAWAAVQPREWKVVPTIDIVIPVYAGHVETLRCLWSVLTAPVVTPHRVIVINDAGPIPELNALIRSLAARDLFVLEQHRVNLGFVKSVNHGLRLARDNDVVILNSDTEVYNDWLDRLIEHALNFPKIGSITPLSNNATICSYPETLGDNRLPLEIEYPELDRMAAVTNRGTHVYAPTGVGFCMYLRRAALHEVGLLDERRFGRGYGEENDLCQRLLKRGWLNAIACDVFVRHVGSVSFKAEALTRTQQALKTLNRLHPNYAGDVERYIADDPTKVYRARLDLARLARQGQQKNILMVCHNRGGGTERHLLEQSQHLLAQGCGVYEVRPSPKEGCVSFSHPSLFWMSNLAAVPLQPGSQLDEALDALKISEIHLHHLIDFAPDTGIRLIEAAKRRNVKVRLAVHDYFFICPRVNMVAPNGRYCGGPEADGCNSCLRQDQLIDRTGSIQEWRAASAAVLRGADQVVAPSHDVAGRLQALVPDIVVEVEPHEELKEIQSRVQRPLPGEPVRILVIGAIGKIKGYDVILMLAQQIKNQQLPCEISLLGFSADDSALAAMDVKILGRYFDHELGERIEAVNPHMVFIPSIWPETYCYTLSAALASGRRAVVFDLGAQAERARSHAPHHVVLPLALAEHPEHLLTRLLWEARNPPVQHEPGGNDVSQRQTIE